MHFYMAISWPHKKKIRVTQAQNRVPSIKTWCVTYLCNRSINSLGTRAGVLGTASRSCSGRAREHPIPVGPVIPEPHGIGTISSQEMFV